MVVEDKVSSLIFSRLFKHREAISRNIFILLVTQALCFTEAYAGC